MADDTIMATPVSPKKPKVKKRLGKDIAKEEAKPSKSSEDLLPWISLTGRSSAKATCYTHDGGCVTNWHEACKREKVKLKEVSQTFLCRLGVVHQSL